MFQTGFFFLQLKTEEVQYGNTLLPWLQRVSKHNHECFMIAKKDEELRRQIIVHHEDQYQKVNEISLAGINQQYLNAMNLLPNNLV